MEQKVTIIITTYKGAASIDDAICSCLQQTYKNIEIIVVDDNGLGSIQQKETYNVVKKYINSERVYYYAHESNMNGSAARNTGLKYSKGHYIAFLDDDDIYTASRIKKCVSFLELNSEYDGVYTDVLRYSENYINVVKSHDYGDYIEAFLLNDCVIGTGSNIFITKKSINDLHGFDSSFIRHQDVEFMIRFVEKYKLGCINEILVIKGNNGISNVPNYYKFKELKEHFFLKFSKQILLLSDLKQKKVKLFHHNQLFSVACKSNDKNIINDSIQYLRGNNIIISKEMKLKKFIFSNKFLFNFLKKLKHQINYKKQDITIDELSEEVKDTLKRFYFKMNCQVDKKE